MQVVTPSTTASIHRQSTNLSELPPKSDVHLDLHPPTSGGGRALLPRLSFEQSLSSSQAPSPFTSQFAAAVAATPPPDPLDYLWTPQRGQLDVRFIVTEDSEEQPDAVTTRKRRQKRKKVHKACLPCWYCLHCWKGTSAAVKFLLLCSAGILSMMALAAILFCIDYFCFRDTPYLIVFTDPVTPLRGRILGGAGRYDLTRSRGWILTNNIR